MIRIRREGTRDTNILDLLLRPKEACDEVHFLVNFIVCIEDRREDRRGFPAAEELFI